MFLFLEPIKTKLKDFTFFSGDEGMVLMYETIFPKKTSPLRRWFLGVTLNNLFIQELILTCYKFDIKDILAKLRKKNFTNFYQIN